VSEVLDAEKRAYHESGHCCAFHHYFNGIVEGVAITEDSGCCKLSQWERELSEEEVDRLVAREVLLNSAISGCAGKFSTAKCNGHAKDYGWKKSNDRAKAFARCLTLADNDEVAAEHLLSYAMRRAELLVEKQWNNITKIASALLEKEKLTGEEVSKLLSNGKVP
jgi:hypothetical protein